MSVVGNATDTGIMSLVDYLTNQKNESSILDTSTTATKADMAIAANNAAKNKASNAYGGGASSAVGQEALNRALKELSALGNGRITFAQIAEYRADLEEAFSTKLRLELMTKGVSPETEFTLTMTSDGSIQVQCDDAKAKEVIKKYLKDNPDACEQFGYIQALANVERARQSPASIGWNMSNMKAEIQASAVSEFFSDAQSNGVTYASLMASFGLDSNSASFYAGVDYLV